MQINSITMKVDKSIKEAFDLLTDRIYIHGQYDLTCEASAYLNDLNSFKEIVENKCNEATLFDIKNFDFECLIETLRYEFGKDKEDLVKKLLKIHSEH